MTAPPRPPAVEAMALARTIDGAAWSPAFEHISPTRCAEAKRRALGIAEAIIAAGYGLHSEAKAEERERCARIADKEAARCLGISKACDPDREQRWVLASDCASIIAAAIRAEDQTP